MSLESGVLLKKLEFLGLEIIGGRSLTGLPFEGRSIYYPSSFFLGITFLS